MKSTFFTLKQIQNNDNSFIVKVFIFILLENKYIIITKHILIIYSDYKINKYIKKYILFLFYFCNLNK